MTWNDCKDFRMGCLIGLTISNPVKILTPDRELIAP
jgi:hypothetical protein